MDSGYVKLYRSIKDDGELLSNPKLLAFWIVCLLEATHAPITKTIYGQKVTLNRGELLFGRKSWARMIGLTEKEIRHCIKRLEERGSITLRRATKFTVIFIVNWDAYQSPNQGEGHLKSQRATRGPSAGRLDSSVSAQDSIGTGNGGNHENRETSKKGHPLYTRIQENNISISHIEAGSASLARESGGDLKEKTALQGSERKSRKPSTEATADFKAFYEAYPKKEGELGASKAWDRLYRTEKLPPLRELLDAITRLKGSKQWQDLRYIPNAKKFLEDGLWDKPSDAKKPEYGDEPEHLQRTFSDEVHEMANIMRKLKDRYISDPNLSELFVAGCFYDAVSTAELRLLREGEKGISERPEPCFGPGDRLYEILTEMNAKLREDKERPRKLPEEIDIFAVNEGHQNGDRKLRE